VKGREGTSERKNHRKVEGRPFLSSDTGLLIGGGGVRYSVNPMGGRRTKTNQGTGYVLMPEILFRGELKIRGPGSRMDCKGGGRGSAPVLGPNHSQKTKRGKKEEMVCGENKQREESKGKGK